MNFIFPTSRHNISDDFAKHKARKSVNPGVDFAVGTGSIIVAPAAGVVVIADGDPGGAAGRVVAIDFDNGFGCDLLHLSQLDVGQGQRVGQGDRVGLSGASANGSNTGVGPHLHISLRNRHGGHLSGTGNVDFMERVAGVAAAGLTGAGILRDQQRLNVWAAADGAERLVEDGIMGPKTTARIKDFQSKHGLAVDGIAGPLTDAVLSTDPPATPGQHPPTVKLGSSGSAVIELQNALNAFGAGLVADGAFGPLTDAAVRAFQSSHGLVVDGIVGPITWTALGR
jgi:murein DD-endopeptidase MepM/ murein hydrolase activator NlpD